MVTYFAYDARGALIGEYWTGTVVAGTQYLTVDHLGSTRVVTNGDQTVASRVDYEPFGQEVASSAGDLRANVTGYNGAPRLEVKFTGKERDAETGLDEPLYDQSLFDPQSWNLYSYGWNNPLVNIDPSGRSCVKTQTVGPDGKTSESSADDGDGKGCAAAGIKADDKRGLKASGQQFNVNARQGSTLAYIFAPPVPRYVADDKPLEGNAQEVLAQVGEITAPIAILADCAAESFLPFATAAGGESVYQLGQPTVLKPFAAGGNP